jgi:hypothetical protein
MFSVIYKGKAISVVWKMYHKKKGHLPEVTHRVLLKELSVLLPPNCRVIITGDEEFKESAILCDVYHQNITSKKPKFVLNLIIC